MPKKKRTVKKRKNKTSKTKLKVRILKTEVEQLRILIEFSERNITGKSEGLDAFFTNQVERLAIKLHELESK